MHSNEPTEMNDMAHNQYVPYADNQYVPYADNQYVPYAERIAELIKNDPWNSELPEQPIESPIPFVPYPP